MMPQTTFKQKPINAFGRNLHTIFKKGNIMMYNDKLEISMSWDRLDGVSFLPYSNIR